MLPFSNGWDKEADAFSAFISLEVILGTRWWDMKGEEIIVTSEYDQWQLSMTLVLLCLIVTACSNSFGPT